MPLDPLAHATTFESVLRHWATTTPDARAFAFLGNGDAESEALTYGELDRGARRIAEALRARGARGRALLLYAPGLAYIEAFMGCLYAGVVAVPVYPPEPSRLDRTLPRLRAIAARAQAELVLTTTPIQRMAGALLSQAPEFAKAVWIATDTLTGDPAYVAPDNTSGSVAFLQYTSGSTGAPRGVRLTHGNLLHNERGIRKAFGHDQRTCVGVGWLPTYHDMGLIGKVLQTMYLGTFTALMSPLSFLQRPIRWLRAIDRYRGGTSGGPNFAYELLTRRVTDAELETLDLSSWKVAFCGAEPIHRDTLLKFAARFRRCGFEPEALFPCYGLAESTLMVSGGWLGANASLADLRAEALERDLAQPAAPGTLGSVQVVGCGPALDGLEVQIVRGGQALPDGGVGEVWVRGGSVAAGYWDDPQATAETFDQWLDDGRGPYLKTGDLGFLRGGELFVTGREKDLLIVHGRNLYPQDVEATAAAAHPAVRAGCVAAFAVQDGPEEKLGLVAELSTRVTAPPGEVAEAVRRAVAAAHDLSVHDLVFTEARALPKTSSGKLQRRATRAMVDDAGLPVVARWIGGRPADADAVCAEAPYTAPGAYFEKLEGRNTNYRFDLEGDVQWDRCAEPGLYFTRDVLKVGGLDLDAMGALPGLVDRFQWALAVAICEEFVALEQRIVHFLRVERAAGRLPTSRSVGLFDEEEVKHVRLFRRYADELKAQRPEWAGGLDRHLRQSFETAWWWADGLEDYPSTAVYHYVTWLHFLYFEEYSIYLHNTLAKGQGVQPAWLTAHAAHMREETQHVITDAAYVDRLDLAEDQRAEWSRWFLDQSAKDASGLAGLEGVWTWLLEAFPELDSLPMPGSLLADVGLRKRAFVRLLNQERAFPRTLAAVVGYDQFCAELAQAPAAGAPAAAPGSDLEARVRANLVQGIAERLGRPADGIDLATPLMYLGLDSIQAVELSGELEALVGRELPPTLLFDHPTIEALARAVAQGGEVPAATTDRSADLALGDDIFEEAAPATGEQVLVTGTTGFLCGFLLAELLQDPQRRAVCLVRAESAAAGLARVRDNLTRYGVWEDAFAERIEAVPGDLAQPLMGLSEAEFAALAQRLDAIYHGGALVDFIQPYERLKPANVDGTREVLRLAFRGGKLPLHFVSTIAVFDTRDQTGRVTVFEDQRPDGRAGFRNGYAESKWVAERLVAQAAERGLPVRIYRPGVVSGHTGSGAWQPDLVAALLSTFATEGVAIRPANDGALDGAPVDYVARAIAYIAAQPGTVGGTFHLTNPAPTPWVAIYDLMGQAGYPVTQADYPEWLARLEANRGQHAMAGYLAYFRAREHVTALRLPQVDHSQTNAALAGSDVACPPIDGPLLARYLDYFARVGLISNGKEAAHGHGYGDARPARA